jgi:hypothetical protein
MSQEIKFPTQTTYFIAYTNTNICGWGVITPQQEMTSGQPYLYQTTVYNDWINELKSFSVYLGYQYYSLENANEAKISVDEYYGPNTATVGYSEVYGSKFWYILGDYTQVLGEPTLFKI